MGTIDLISLLDDLIQFQEEEEKKKHPLPGLAGLATAVTAQRFVSKATMEAVSGQRSSEAYKADRPALAHIYRTARAAGYPIHRSSGGPGFIWDINKVPTEELEHPKGLIQELRKGYHAGLRQRMKQMTGSNALKGIAVSDMVRPYAKPGILAHETGHALQPKWLRGPPARLGILSPLAATPYAAATKDEKRAKTAAVASSLAAVPGLAGEIDASIRGSRLLKQAGMKGIRRLTPGLGVPSYLAVAAMPWAAYGVKKGLGGYKKPEKRLSSLLDDLIQFKTLYQPSKEDKPPEEIPQLEGEIDYTVQRHEARRAGLHRDVRIGTKRHGLLSWATRKQLPSEGGKVAIHPQPVHPHSYLGWEGDIPSGYGAGKVSTEHLGKALVTKSTPTEVHATLADQREHHRLAFLKTAKGWLLTRGKHPVPPKEAQKPKYKSVSPEDAHEHLGSIEPGTIVQPKVDGALVYVTTKGNRPEVFSHRRSKLSGKHVVHTERFFKGRPTTEIPKEHQRTLIGELYGVRKGKAVPPQELGGILNTHLGESIGKQQKKGIKLKIMPFDYADGKGEPYPERLEKVKATLRHLPKDTFHAPEEAKTPGAARRLFNKIRHGLHPLTQEGVIVHPPKGRMVKIKNVQEENVEISGTFPGSGKFEGSHGGFVYSDKKGNVLGRVGTGFSDETRGELHKYVGRKARIRHQGRYPSGAYRAPSFIAVEENK